MLVHHPPTASPVGQQGHPARGGPSFSINRRPGVKETGGQTKLMGVPEETGGQTKEETGGQTKLIVFSGVPYRSSSQ